MKKTILVSISNYGEKNLIYLNSVINEYRSYKNYDITINIHSTVPISRNDINVIQYDPTKIGRMAYLHRQEFIDNKENYDLFLYSENDMLIKEECIDVYLKYNELLPINYCLGFLGYERKENDENLYLYNQWPNVYHRPEKFNTEDKTIGPSYITSKELCIEGNWYFMLSNPHQSCYLLTKDKLNIAMSVAGYSKTDWPGIETSTDGIFTHWNHADGILYKVHTRNLEDLKKCLIQHLPGWHVKDPNVFPTVGIFDLLVSDLKLK